MDRVLRRMVKSLVHHVQQVIDLAWWAQWDSNLRPADQEDAAAFDAIHDRWWKIVDQLEDLHAVTHASLIAKAVVLPAIIRDCADEGEPKCRLNRNAASRCP